MADRPEAETVGSPRTIYLKDYQPPAYWVDKVELEFDLAADRTMVSAALHCRRNSDVAKDKTPLVLDGQLLQLQSVSVDDRLLKPDEYSVSDEQLTIHNLPAEFVLQTMVEINPAQNTALEGLYQSSQMLCTQCEAQGFRRITYFPDRPDVMSRYQVTLRADKNTYPVLLANGNPIEKGELADGRHYVVWQDPSLKPSYLFAIVAGQLVYQEDHFTTMSGRQVLLQIYVEEENKHKCDHALASLKQAMHWDEEVYGREYDLDIFMIVAVNDFNMGAMENKGLNIFNASCVLASPETATDNDYYNIQSIIGHEYFHNWSGNRVTCRDWFQLSLKEGFTVFRDQEFSADLNSRGVKRIDDVNMLRTHQFAEDAGPMAHPVRPDQYIEISNFYTVTVYEKGAEVVRMIRNLVGEQGFRRGTDLYFNRYDGQAVTTDDFVKAMEEANGIDLTLFKRWYEQAGTPELDVQGVFDAAKQTYTLTVKQHTPATPNQKDKLPLHIPLAVGLLDEQGVDMPLTLAGESASDQKTKVLELREAEQSFEFINIASTPVPSLLRGFSAPVKLHIKRSDAELAFLMAHDSDAFNRWDAAQQLMIKTLLDMVRQYQSGEELQVPVMLLEALGHALREPQQDPALLDRLLGLPSENYLADQMDVIDVDAIHTAREYLFVSIARSLQEDLLKLYKANKVEGVYRFHASDMAKRALRNHCLAFLAALQTDDMFDLCQQHFADASNMTDSLAVLNIMTDYDTPIRESMLQAFFDRWRHDALVMDKWFATQALSSLPDTLTRVKALMQHPLFTLRNPNRVRSLIARFCFANPVRFHAVDGSGYRFFAEQIIALDKLNPQITARILQAMSRWRRYDTARQKLMAEQLRRIQQQENLSKDASEVVSKILKA